MKDRRSIRIYAQAYFALLALLAVTLGVSFMNLGPYNGVLSVLLAVAKALIVALYFMEVRHGSDEVKVYAGAAALWLLIALILTMADYMTRV